MTLRTVDVSSEGAHLSLSHQQLVVAREGKEVGRVPLEELGLLVLDHQQASYTHPLICGVLEAGAAVLFCGANHLPVGLLLPTVGHHLQTERFRTQLECRLPCRKRLWQQVVQEKIRNQSLATRQPEVRRKLDMMIEKVGSGDPKNVEAQAARVYWEAWRPTPEFRREPEGYFPNGLLNYGYAVLRAAVARALVGAGFHPALGVNHSNRYNAFCLADDMLEPFRPLVDSSVRFQIANGETTVSRAAKTALLGLLYHRFETGGTFGAFPEAMDRMAASLHRCMAGEERQLLFPRYQPVR